MCYTLYISAIILLISRTHCWVIKNFVSIQVYPSMVTSITLTTYIVSWTILTNIVLHWSTVISSSVRKLKPEDILFISSQKSVGSCSTKPLMSMESWLPLRGSRSIRISPPALEWSYYWYLLLSFGFLSWTVIWYASSCAIYSFAIYEIAEPEIFALLQAEIDTSPSDEKFLFFPGLVDLNIRPDVWQPNDQFGYHSGWLLRCSKCEQF